VRPASLPNGRIPLREPPCPGRQVGEGVSPALDARINVESSGDRFKRSDVAAVDTLSSCALQSGFGGRHDEPPE
jgi:hypothetical protein